MLRAVALVVGLCAVFGLVLYVYYSGDTVRTTNSNEQPANYRALAQFSPIDVFFVNPQVGWLVLTEFGNQRILATRNGGKTWYMQLALPVSGVQFVDDHNGWGYIPPQLNPSSAIPTPTDSRTTCDCLVVTHDGGQSWQQLPPAPNSLQNFTFVNDRVGWAATGTSGDRGFESGILRTTDGGVSWQEVTIPSEIASSTASLIGAVDDRTAWLSFCTSDCTKRPLAVTHDGGATWESLASPCDGPNLARPGELAPNVAAYFLSASEGWLLCGGELAVDQQAKALYRTSDSGDHWLLLAESEGPGMPPAGRSLSRLGWVGYSNIQFLNSNEGWLAVGGPSGGPFVTHDGGVTWKDTRESQPPASRVFFLDDGLHGWALTADSLLNTDDGGANWQRIYPPHPIPSTTESSGTKSLTPSPTPHVVRLVPDWSTAHLIAREGDRLQLRIDASGEVVSVDLARLTVFDCRVSCSNDVSTKLQAVSETDIFCIGNLFLYEGEQEGSLWVNRDTCEANRQ